jgi:long-chain acyl-CoA synthetase
MKIHDIPVETYQKVTDPICKTAEVHPDHAFLRIRGQGQFRTYTYGEGMGYVRKLGHYLKRRGFVPGDRAAVIGENCPEWVFSYLGILWAGGIVVPLDTRAKATEWAHLMRHSECCFLFVSSRFFEDVLEHKEGIPGLHEIVSFSDEDPEPNLPTIFREGEGLSEPEKRSRDDVAVILYTSGTTGISKGVMLTHGNLLANMEQCSRILDLTEKDRFFSVLPIHHSFESTCGFHAPLAVGASVTFARSLKSRDLLEDLRATRPTCFLVVPLLLEKMYQGFERDIKKASPIRRGLFYGLRALGRAFDSVTKGRASRKLFHQVRAGMGLDALRYLVSGGAHLPRLLSRDFERLGFPVFQGYGITETAPVLSVNLPGRCKNESVGLPIPGVEVRIADPDATGVGEIIVKGPNVMKGYYKNEEMTREVFRDGWFYTGDLGRMDGDGFLYVTGRKKSLIVTKGGKNISPEEIEEELLKSPFIKEVLVRARIHPRTKNEEIHAILYPDFEALDKYALDKGLPVNEKTIQQLIGQHVENVNKVLADYKRIRNFSIRNEEFPKTTTQKIKRYLFETGGMQLE